MKPPRLDRLVTIEYKSTTQHATYGTDVVTWEPLSEIGSPLVTEKFWAEVVDVQPGRQESAIEGLAISRNLTRIRMRYRNDIDSSMRVIVHGDSDVTMQIVGGPSEIGRKQWIEMLCERISS